MKRTPSQLHREWDTWFYGPLGLSGSREAVLADCFAAPGFKTDHMKIHEAVFSMAEYIDFLRGELKHRDRLQGAARELLGIDKSEVF